MYANIHLWRIYKLSFCFFFVFLLGFANTVYTQNRKRHSTFHEKTSSTDLTPDHKTFNKKKIIPIFISTESSRKVLYGNGCALEVTRKMGFEFTVMTNIEKEKYGSGFWSNFWSSVKLSLKNGPFWREAAQKKINNCRKMSGDFVG